MNHLSRLLVSTKAQVCFISETRDSSISKASLINCFHLKDAHIVLSVGQSGGLWLLWKDEVDVNIFDQNHHFIFVICTIRSTNQNYGLVCMYGDPHHQTMDVIWDQVLNFVTCNSNLPILCMGDFNELMHGNEKLGSTVVDARRINNFCAYVKHCGFIDLGYNGPAYTWTNKRFSSVPTYERLDRY